MPKLRALLILVAALVGATIAHAEDRITLGEILPVLRGSPAGEVDLGPAPLPGNSRVVRAQEIRAALASAGHDARGLNIPSTTRVERAAQSIERSALERLARPELDRAFFPCTVSDVQLPARVTLGRGDVTVAATAAAPRQSGHASASLVVSAGGIASRLAVVADVECPEPVVNAGSHVQIVAVVGHVRATAPGVASQPGRVGDEIRVTSTVSRATLRARVVDGTTVEVLP